MRMNSVNDMHKTSYLTARSVMEHGRVRPQLFLYLSSFTRPTFNWPKSNLAISRGQTLRSADV